MDDKNLIWIDLEMTGLDPQKDTIIEIATIVTDKDLTILAEGPVLAIKTSDEIIAAMDEWNTEHHRKSGLIKRVKESTTTLKDAEQQTIEFLKKWVPQGVSPMCGNTICQDRRFMARLMPKLQAYFHYRHIDVSTIKELVARWNPTLFEEINAKKKEAHLALEDIRESIEELKFYREHVFKI